MACKITPSVNGLVVETPFNRTFVGDLKMMIPAHERKWNGKTDNPPNVWLVHPKHVDLLIRLIERNYHETVAKPILTTGPAPVQRRTFKMHYVGASKTREDGSKTAFATLDGSLWNLVFTEEVLKEWFEGSSKTPTRHTTGTLFAVLGIGITNDEQELKSAFKRMARQWHPDVCKEPDAEERFKEINEAYHQLVDPDKRKLYIAGLTFSSRTQLGSSTRGEWYGDYKPPLRCGLIEVDCREELGRFMIEKIIKWDDLTDEYGRILVSSWNWRNQSLEEQWVNP